MDYIGFEEFTLVPFEPNLIDYKLLSPAEVRDLLSVIYTTVTAACTVTIYIVIHSKEENRLQASSIKSA